MVSALVYGLHDLEEVRDRTVQSVGVRVVEDGMNEWYRAYIESTDRFLERVLQRDPVWNTMPITRARLPYTVDMQLVDEDGKADPVTAYSTYDIGLPLQRRELANGWTWERSLVITVNDVNEWLTQIMSADSRSFRTAAKRALFYNVGWNFLSNEEDANFPSTIPIVPLANGDAQTYPLKTGLFATAQHYTAQAAQVGAGTDPFQTIYDNMTRYATVSALRPNLVAFVNGATMIAAIKALADFEPVTDFRFIQPAQSAVTVSDAILNQLYFGDKVLGEHVSGITVVQWSDLPDNYIVVMDMDQLPLGMRERPEPALQGLFGLTGMLSHYGNERHDRVRRIMGISVVNRTAAHVHFVAAGDTVYDVPTGYTPSV